MAVLEDRIDADLASGEHARLVGELEALVREHPLRERLRGQLMLALYRSGRQADALEAYQHRPRSAASTSSGSSRVPRCRSSSERSSLRTRRSRRRPRALGGPRGPTVRRGGALIAAGGGALLAAMRRGCRETRWLGRGCGAGGAELGGRDRPSQRPRRRRGSGRDAAGPDRVRRRVAVGREPRRPDRLARRPGTLQTLQGDPGRGSTDRDRGERPGGVWVVGSTLDPTRPVDQRAASSAASTRSSTRDRRAIGNVEVAAAGPVSVAAQSNSVWVAPSSGVLTRLTANGRARAAVRPELQPGRDRDRRRGVYGLTDSEGGNVIRVDPTGLLTPIAVGNGPSGIAVGEGGVWVADSLDDAVVRIDPATRSVTTTIAVGDSPAGVAVGAGSVWVANSGDGTVTRIDPRTDRVVATITVGGSPQAITVADGRAWVTVDAQRSTSLAVPGAGRCASTRRDTRLHGPGAGRLGLGPRAPVRDLRASCSTTRTSRVAAGSQLDARGGAVAAGRSADGRTYTFTIRPGFRFSPPSNQPVTAQTFKDTIERTLNPSDGERVCGRVPRHRRRARVHGRQGHPHLWSRGARNTLMIRLVAPGPDLLARLGAAAVLRGPTRHPDRSPGSLQRDPDPAGPYYVASLHSRPRGRAGAPTRTTTAAVRVTSHGSSYRSGSPLPGRSPQSRPVPPTMSRWAPTRTFPRRD